MISFLECFSPEVLFEIFEYLSPYNLFRSFLNLNDRLNKIVSCYPIHLNFRSISRLEFDYICSHLQPKQVISLILSDETIPRQVQIFKEYFPLFQQEFLYLQSVTLIEIFDDKLDLPKSVQSIEIRKYDIYINFDFNFDRLLEEQAKFLRHLKIDRIGLLKYIETPFPVLTHLTIDGGFIPDVEDYLAYDVQYENVNATSIFQRLQSSITHLSLFIDKQNPTMNINLESFSHCLTHLTLHYVEDGVVSFQSIEQCIENLYQLTDLTIQASGQDQLIDGYRWKNVLSKTKIIHFNFKFQLLNENSGFILLESFRSSFWLKEKHWYVAYYIDEEMKETFLCTVPKFRFKDIIYPSSHFPVRTTAPTNMEQNLFYQKKIDSLSIDINQFLIPPTYRFEKVRLLKLFGSTLISLDILQKILDLNQIEQLDVYSIDSLSRYELKKLIEHCPRLNNLIMEYHPLFLVPSQIHTLRLAGDSRSIPIDNLCSTIPNIKYLQIPIYSTDRMLDIIDQMDYINLFEFNCEKLWQGDYLECFIEKLRLYWMEKNSYRLAMNHFTYRQGEEYQHIQMAIGGPKTKKYSDF